MRNGIKILEDFVGDGAEIERHRFYRMSLRIWLNKGDPVVWTKPFGLLDQSHISEDGLTLMADYRIDREFLFGGLFYGVEGMRIGGKRLLKISPHLAYREAGVEGMIPPKAVLKVEVFIHGERKME
jgi:hypothetical protein